jgi:hypothetical protein
VPEPNEVAATCYVGRCGARCRLLAYADPLNPARHSVRAIQSRVHSPGAVAFL